MQILLLYTLLAATMGVVTFELLRGVNQFKVTNALGITVLLILLAVALLSFPRPGNDSAASIVREDNWLRVEPFVSAISWHKVGSSAGWIYAVLRAIFVAALPLFGVPFLTMLYQKWVGELASPEEKTAGSSGFRAWFCPRNIIWVAILVIGLWVWLDVALVTGIIAAVILLAAYPIYRLTSDNACEEQGQLAPAKETVASDERGIVLRLVESGKVTAEEGAELLNALAATYAAGASKNSDPRSPMTKSQRLLLCGLAITIAGFFLPWLRIDTQAELQRSSGQITKLMEAFPESRAFVSNMSYQMPVITLTGSQMKVGWVIIIALLVSASTTLLPIELRLKTRRSIQVACQAVAGLMVLYIITSSLGYLAVTFLVVLVGYTIQIIALKMVWHLPAFR